MSRRRICVVTGSRADYGLLYWPMRRIREDPRLELQVAVTGMHLAPGFGLTYRRIEEDGFALDARVEMLLAGDSAVAVSKSLGLGVIGFADAFDRLRPDVVMVLGDRFEILAAAQAALLARIPVAHLAGGDTTEGAFDEAIRHAVTKMAHLHFVTNEESARRVRQLGENPAQVYNVGSPGLDHLGHFELMDRTTFFESVGLVPRARNLLVAFHPETLAPGGSLGQLEELLAALDDDFGLLLTGSNADPEGRELSRRLEAFANRRDHAVFHLSLGQPRFWNALRHVDAIVGNSSSGLYEAPSFKTPAVNVGDRQRGRRRPASVIDCPAERGAIAAAIEQALALDCRGVVNPYGDGRSAPRIVAVLRRLEDPRALLKKRFFDPEAG